MVDFKSMVGQFMDVDGEQYAYPYCGAGWETDNILFYWNDDNQCLELLYVVESLVEDDVKSVVEELLSALELQTDRDDFIYRLGVVVLEFPNDIGAGWDLLAKHRVSLYTFDDGYLEARFIPD